MLRRCRFWFAGALGMLLESRKLQFWASQAAIEEVEAAKDPSEVVPPSWNYSFNPIPGSSLHHSFFPTNSLRQLS